MFKLSNLALCIAMALTPLSVTAGATSAQEQALMEADGNWLAMSKDAHKFIAHTDDEFRFFPPNAPFMDDRKAAEDYWDAVINTPGLTLVWAPEGAEVSTDGDMGFTYGFYTLTTADDAGKETVAKGKYVTVMRMQESGEWRPMVDIFNAN